MGASNAKNVNIMVY